MIKKVFEIGCLLFFISFTVVGQDDQMTRLLKERDKLYNDYEYFNQQNNSLFGKKSKKDLQNIIHTLQGIINKDSEIIKEIKKMYAQMHVETNQKESSYIGQTRETLHIIENMRGETDKLTAQVKLKSSELATLREYNQKLEERTTFLSIILGIMVVAIIVLIVYSRKLKMAMQGKDL